MRVLDKAGKPVPHVYCIGDANGKLMLAHAASAQVGGQTLHLPPCCSGCSWEHNIEWRCPMLQPARLKSRVSVKFCNPSKQASRLYPVPQGISAM